MRWLGTTKPLITLADYKLEMLGQLLINIGWEFIECQIDLYRFI